MTREPHNEESDVLLVDDELLLLRLENRHLREAIGQLAGGVAHDLNNQLTAINGYAELALRRLRVGDPLTRYLEEIRRVSNRSALLTKALLTFSRQHVLEPHALDLNSFNFVAKTFNPNDTKNEQSF